MPSVIPRIKTTTQLDKHTVEIQTKDNRASTIYTNLQSYDYDPATASHPMPGWTYYIPTTQKIIEFNFGYGEMYYDGSPYSVLSTEQKQQFWQWIDKAIVYGMKEYDKTWGF
jgi:hypothetical protein